MLAYALDHLRDDVLLRDLTALVARDRATTAALLAHLAEVDSRRLYTPAGYESMHAYCVDELHFSEDSAYKRIQAARAARKCPSLLTALAEGRLHLTAIVFLAPHLTPENADVLVAAATHRRKADIQQWLAQRFPQAAPPIPFTSQRLPTPVVGELVPEPVADHVPAPALEPSTVVEESRPPAESVLLQIRVARSTHDKLRYAQALLSHAIPSGDEAAVLDRALDALIARCEKRKFAATAAPRARQRPTSAPRHVPAHVKREVWERDQGRCTFVGDTGHRCGSRRFLEFDHVDPVARGGRATVEGMRLRCRAHNQYEAERAFGAGFMERKRAKTGRVSEPETALRVSSVDVRAQARAVEREEQSRDVIAALRRLGCRLDEARRAVESTATHDDITLEERLRAALKFLRPRPAPGARAGHAARDLRIDPAPLRAESSMAVAASP